MNAKELIDLICPEHFRTSCSDEEISNGFYIENDGETINNMYYPRCRRCALLEIVNGKIKLTEQNKELITEKTN